jgi:hypothetical protein
MGAELTSIDETLDSYSSYVRKADARTANRFERNRKSDPEAAIAEAITFRMLQTIGAHPTIYDRVGRGGPDFLCNSSRWSAVRPCPASEFFVEATSLDPDSVSKKSGLANEARKELGGGAFGLVTQNICNKAKDKDRTSLKNCSKPAVLSIVSSHLGAALLFDAHAAETALVSGLHFRHEIGSAVADPNWYTNLKDSVFIKPGAGGSIETCRQNISAILLIAVYGDKSEVFGILHPAPRHPLNIEHFPNIPFFRITTWPINDKKIWTEWVVGRPYGLHVPHGRVSLP